MIELTTPGKEGQTPKIESLTQLLGAESTEDRAQGLPEYSAELPPGVDGDWSKRILVLRDSLSVQEIVRVLYQEQLDRGAGLADLGTWKSYFDQSVIETIARLAGYGYLQAAPSGVLDRRTDLATTAKRKRTEVKGRKAASDKKERKAASDKSVEMTPAPSQQAAMEATSSPGTAREWATAGGMPEPEKHNGFGVPGEAGEAAPLRRRLATAFVALVARIVQRRMLGVDGESVPESRAGRG